jgi:hypothetical protein
MDFTLAGCSVNSSRTVVGANRLPSWIFWLDPAVSGIHSTIMAHMFGRSRIVSKLTEAFFALDVVVF